MRWKTFDGFKNGDTRVSKYFALFPVDLEDGYTVWLESYWAVERFDTGSIAGTPVWLPILLSSTDPLLPTTPL